MRCVEKLQTSCEIYGLRHVYTIASRGRNCYRAGMYRVMDTMLAKRMRVERNTWRFVIAPRCAAAVLGAVILLLCVRGVSVLNVSGVSNEMSGSPPAGDLPMQAATLDLSAAMKIFGKATRAEPAVPPPRVSRQPLVLELAGLIFSANAARSRAILEVNGQPQALYEANDVLPDGHRLVAIEKDRVIISDGSENRELLLTGRDPITSVARLDPSNAALPDSLVQRVASDQSVSSSHRSSSSSGNPVLARMHDRRRAVTAHRVEQNHDQVAPPRSHRSAERLVTIRSQ